MKLLKKKFYKINKKEEKDSWELFQLINKCKIQN